jgi:hypothetical protein
MSTEEMVVRVHRAVIAAMEAVTGGEFTVEQMQNLRADARALARRTDQKIGEMGHLIFGDMGVRARAPEKVELKVGEEWTDVTEHVDTTESLTVRVGGERGFLAKYLDAAYERGVSEGRRQATEAAAYKIRAELVCCDIYEQLRPLRELEPSNYRDLFDAIDDHDLCYWGEASARIAESINEKDGTDG